MERSKQMAYDVDEVLNNNNAIKDTSVDVHVDDLTLSDGIGSPHANTTDTIEKETNSSDSGIESSTVAIDISPQPQDEKDTMARAENRSNIPETNGESVGEELNDNTIKDTSIEKETRSNSSELESDTSATDARQEQEMKESTVVINDEKPVRRESEVPNNADQTSTNNDGSGSVVTHDIINESGNNGVDQSTSNGGSGTTITHCNTDESLDNEGEQDHDKDNTVPCVDNGRTESTDNNGTVDRGHDKNDKIPRVDHNIATENPDKNPTEESNNDSGLLTTESEHTRNPPRPNIKTLADLILVCRDRGLQIFNDKRNVPESDQLTALPEYLTNSKVHRSDGINAKRGRSSVSSRHSLRPTSYRQSESLESQNRIASSHSGWTTRSYKSRSDSRLEKTSLASVQTRVQSRVQSGHSTFTDHSSGHQTVYTNTSFGNSSSTDMYNGGHKPFSTWSKKFDFPDVEGDIEAETILQQRMRRKSKRKHRETLASLVDIIKLKQEELQMMENKISAIKDGEQASTSEDNPANVETTKDNDGKANEVGTTEEGTNSSQSNKSNGIIGKDNAKESEKPGSKTVDKNESNNSNSVVKVTSTKEDLQKETVEHVRDAKQGDDVSKETGDTATNGKNVVKKQTDKQKEEMGQETEIQEYVIQDGNTKLVLYKLKTNTSLLENQKKESNNKDLLENGSNENENDTNNEKNITNSEKKQSNGAKTKSNTNRSRKQSDKETKKQTKTDKNIEISNSKTDEQPIPSGPHSKGVKRDAVSRTVPPCDTEKHPPGTPAESGDVNNSSGLNGNINRATYVGLPQRNIPQSTSNRQSAHESSVKVNEKTIENNDSDYKVTEISTGRTNVKEKYIEEGKSEGSLDSEVNTTTIDRDGELNDNKNNLNPDNDSRNTVANTSHTTSEPDIKDKSVISEENQDLENTDNTDKTVDGNKVENGDTTTMSEHADSNCENNVVIGDHNNPKSEHGIVNRDNVQVDQISENKQDSVNQINNTPTSSDEKSNVSKKPKRSYGNGFLVSGDDNDGDRDVKDPDSEEKDVSNAGADSTPKPDDTVHKDKQSGKLDPPKPSPSTTSGRKSKTNTKSFSSVARQVLIASTIKHTFDEEKSKQISFVKELGDTRLALRELYRRLKNGEDFSVDKTMDTEDLPESSKPEKDVDKKETVQEEEHDVTPDDEEKPEVEPKEPAREEPEEEQVTETDTNDTQASESEPQPEPPASSRDEQESIGNASSKSSQKSKRRRAEKKVDNSWSPSHPLYEQIQTGFKSKVKRHDTRHVHQALKGYHSGQFDTNQMSSENVYIVEAKRIYPKGFPESATKEVKVINKPKYNTKEQKEIQKLSDPVPRYNPDKLVREHTLYRRKDTQNEESKPTVVNNPKTSKRVSTNSESKQAQAKPETATPKTKGVKRYRFKKRSNVVDVVDIEDEKLNRDKASVDQLQQYMNSTADVPEVKTKHRKHTNATVVQSKHRDSTSKKGPTKIPQAKFTSYDNDKEDEGIESLDDESEPELNIIRGNVRERFSRYPSERSLGSDKKTDDVPMSKAVEIVQSRQKFYNNDDGSIQTSQREHRVFKLFREFQMLRHGQGQDDSFDTSTFTDYSPNSPRFLTMDYEFSRSTITSHRTDTDLQKFLNCSIDYDSTINSRSLHSFPRRRDRALNELRQKLNQRPLYSSNVYP